ncbi:MAG: SoxR reducing system RseC family protein [Phascolarctobacterium sp.]|nr:SoxR reducing system RseC family protein [Phascolarctobacterium sp.]
MAAEIKGLLIKKYGERAEVKVDRTQTKVTGIPKYLDCWCPINAKVGDVVGVEYQELEKRKGQMVIYGFPVLGVVAGYAFGQSLATFFHMDALWFIVGGIVLWTFIALNYVRTFKRDAIRQGAQPVVVEIDVPEMTIDLNDKPSEESK